MPRRSLKARVADAEARVKLAELGVRHDRLKLQKKAMKAALSTYDAAKRDRTNRDWRAPNVSADLAIINDSPTLIARARQMVRDDSYAASIVKSFRRNVVGTGINPSFSAIDRGGKPMDNFNRMADAEWHDWASRADLVDIEGKRNFVDVEKWAINEIVTVGEAFVIWRYDLARFNKAGDCGLNLQCIEAEQLDNTLTACGSNEVRGGVEVDGFGKAVAYHFWTRHPNDLTGGGNSGNWHPDPSIRKSDERDTRESWEKGTQSFLPRSVRVEAERVLHIFDPERAHQTRGVSRFHPVLTRLRDVGQFEYAELLKARAQACIGMTIQGDPATFDSLGMSAGDASETDSDGNDELSFQPIMVARLAKGETATAFTPTSPGGQFTPFMMQELRAIAAGAGISYEQVARDFSQGTYSSQRQGMLEDRREFEPLQQLIISKLCQPVARQFVAWSILEGRLPGGAPLNALAYVTWRGQGWAWIDPEKEAKAHHLALALGLTTKQQVLLDHGDDWREIARQRAIEQEFDAELRLPPMAPPSGMQQAPTEVDEPAPASEAVAA